MNKPDGPEDATEALLDKMAKDSFPASDPPQLVDVEAQAKWRPAPGPALPGPLAERRLGEEVDGREPGVALVLGGRDDAVVLQIVADGRRLQLALARNPLELDAADLHNLIAALTRQRSRLRDDPPPQER